MKRCLAVLVFLTAACGTPETNKGTDKEVNEREEGEIKVELFEKEAPITVKNFLQYVDDKHYDGMVFHRVMSDFMIQGGGFKKGVSKAKGPDAIEALKKPGRAPIRNEAKNGVSNTRGTLAMARTGDPHSATDQFFINVVDNSSKLDPGKLSKDGYAVFGKVIDGMDFVDRIKGVRVRNHFGHEAVPVEDVVIESARREESNGPNPVVVLKVSKGK